MTLPIPSLQYIPKVYRDNPTAGTLALTNKIDSNLIAWRKEIIELGWITSAVKCPAMFLDEIGYMFNSAITPTDSETTKRKKIFYAIQNNQLRGTWLYSAKVIIDAITGYNAQQYTIQSADDWIMTGDGMIEVDNPDWSILGGDVVFDDGFSLIGDGTEIELWGNIYIDLHYGIHTAVLTADQIIQIVTAIQDDIVPAYFRIYLGYVPVAGGFQVYTGGTIG
jgi:hypothetical protein